MIGTFVNVVCILIGSIIGSCLKRALPSAVQKTLFNAMGLAAFAIGINAIASNMPNSTMPVLFIVSLALGSLIGTILKLDYRINTKMNKTMSSSLSQGLTTAFLLFCIGTLSILGPIQSALYNDYSYLYTNATLDLVTSSVLASTYGIGIALAAPMLLVWQGSIYLFASYIEPFISDALMCELSIVGGLLIMASGLSILEIKDFKTLNMLPSLFIPVAYFIILSFI